MSSNVKSSRLRNLRLGTGRALQDHHLEQAFRLRVLGDHRLYTDRDPRTLDGPL